MMRPESKIAMRSERVSASSWSWVTKMVVMPTWRWMRRSSTCISWRRCLSSAPSGSSSSSTFGRVTSARARATRCCCPPESCFGLRCSSPPRRTIASASFTRRATSSRERPRTSRPNADVLRHRHVREQRVVLEHHADVAGMHRHAADILPVDQHLAAVQRDEAGDRAQQRGLAAAARSQQAEELAVAERHGDAVERRHRVVFLHRIGDGRRCSSLTAETIEARGQQQSTHGHQDDDGRNGVDLRREALADGAIDLHRQGGDARRRQEIGDDELVERDCEGEQRRRP